MGTRKFPDAETARRLVALWAETGPLLEKIRETELASQSAEQSRIAAYDMMQLGSMLPSDFPEEECGLVEMQRLFARGRDRERRQSSS